MHVNVVNSYAAASDSVPVNLHCNVDLPTEGKPINATRASPRRATSNPSLADIYCVYNLSGMEVVMCHMKLEVRGKTIAMKR